MDPGGAPSRSGRRSSHGLIGFVTESSPKGGRRLRRVTSSGARSDPHHGRDLFERQVRPIAEVEDMPLSLGEAGYLGPDGDPITASRLRRPPPRRTARGVRRWRRSGAADDADPSRGGRSLGTPTPSAARSIVPAIISAQRRRSTSWTASAAWASLSPSRRTKPNSAWPCRCSRSMTMPFEGILVSHRFDRRHPGLLPRRHLRQCERLDAGFNDEQSGHTSSTQTRPETLSRPESDPNDPPSAKRAWFPRTSMRTGSAVTAND